MRKLKSGYINGTRVMLGNLGDFLNTSAITDLSFLGSQEDGYPDSKFIIFFVFILDIMFFYKLYRIESSCTSIFRRTFIAFV